MCAFLLLLRWRNPSKWLADRLADAAEKQARRSDPEYLRQMMEARSLKAKRAYETRRRNGNSGMGRPRSKVDQVRAVEFAARAAEARAAAVQAGYATDNEFNVSTEGRRPKISVKVKKKVVPQAKRRRGRPRKLLTYEERVDIAFREVFPPRPRGRPRKVRPRLTDMSSSALLHVSVSVKSAIMKSMAEAATRTAAKLPGVLPLGLEPRVEALAVAKTQELTGAKEREWSPQMTAIAAVGIEAWGKAWEKARGAAMQAGEGEEWSREEWSGGGGRPEGEWWSRLGPVLDADFLLDAATVAEVDTWAPRAFGMTSAGSVTIVPREPTACEVVTRCAEVEVKNDATGALVRQSEQDNGPNDASKVDVLIDAHDDVVDATPEISPRNSRGPPTCRTSAHTQGECNSA